MTTRVWGAEYRTTTVCIDSYENGVMVGRFYNPYLAGGKQFHSLTQFLLEMEKTLDAMGIPKAYTAARTFTPGSECEDSPPEQLFQWGAAATFSIRILFRQNAAWQGSVIWMEGRQEQSFRSVLELIMLLNSALEYKKAS